MAAIEEHIVFKEIVITMIGCIFPRPNGHNAAFIIIGSTVTDAADCAVVNFIVMRVVLEYDTDRPPLRAVVIVKNSVCDPDMMTTVYRYIPVNLFNVNSVNCNIGTSYEINCDGNSGKYYFFILVCLIGNTQIFSAGSFRPD